MTEEIRPVVAKEDGLLPDDSPYYSPSPTCVVCGEPSTVEPNAYLCGRCKKVRGPKTLSSEQKTARIEHMIDQWRRNGEFRCHYTGVPLELENRIDVRYREWEHATPGVEGSVVLAAALVNRMKCYLNAEEFRRMVAELARYFADPTTPFRDTAFPTKLIPPSDQP
jgi:hypothetical protein